jgi:hypothetical protein
LRASKECVGPGAGVGNKHYFHQRYTKESVSVFFQLTQTVSGRTGSKVVRRDWEVSFFLQSRGAEQRQIYFESRDGFCQNFRLGMVKQIVPMV